MCRFTAAARERHDFVRECAQEFAVLAIVAFQTRGAGSQRAEHLDAVGLAVDNDPTIQQSYSPGQDIAACKRGGPRRLEE